MASSEELRRGFDEIVTALDEFRAALEDATQAAGAVGGGGGRGKSGGSRGARMSVAGAAEEAAGGAGGDLFAMLGAARAHPVVAGIAAAGAVAAPVVTAGIQSMARGGEFEGGFWTQVNRQAARIPIVGQLTGATQRARAMDAALGALNAQTGDLAELVGPEAFDPRAREWFAREERRRAENRVRDEEMNLNALERQFTTEQGRYRGISPPVNVQPASNVGGTQLFR